MTDPVFVGFMAAVATALAAGGIAAAVRNFGGHGARISVVESRLDTNDERFAEIKASIEKIERKIDRLIERWFGSEA